MLRRWWRVSLLGFCVRLSPLLGFVLVPVAVNFGQSIFHSYYKVSEEKTISLHFHGAQMAVLDTDYVGS